MPHRILLATLLISTAALFAQVPAGRPASLFDQLDRNNDTVLVAEEIPEAQAQAFRRLIRIGDRNKDGRLTRSEFLSSLNSDSDSDSEPTTTTTDQPPARSRFNRPTRNRPTRTTTTTTTTTTLDPNLAFKRLDQNNDGRLVVEEFPESIQKRIAAYLNQTGKNGLSRDDFAKLYRARQVGTPAEKPDRKPVEKSTRSTRTTQRGPAIFRIIDLNRDGRISRNELAQAAKHFEQLDANRDGQLDPREFFGARTDRPQTPERSASKTNNDQNSDRPQPTRQRPDATEGTSLFGRLDRNGDGAIEVSEVPMLLRERLKRLDTDGDGRISPDEFRAGLKAKTQQLRQRPRDK